MRGMMMQSPLTLTAMLERGGRLFPEVEVVSRVPRWEDALPGVLPGNYAAPQFHRYTFADFYQRSRRLAAALVNAGIRPGDRVGTLMWNHYAHLECYFGIPAAGAVTHTLNLRLHPDELAYIINHAEDRFIIVDDVLLPLLQQFRANVSPERVIVAQHNPGAPGGSETNYEDFIGGAEPCEYAQVDENDAAALCYTSGTTGKPKGVLYSHRSMALHSLAIGHVDGFAISMNDTVLPAMSMFHANGWGVPYAAVMAGSKLVLPSRYVDAENLLNLLQAEQVSFSGAVPTIWLAVAEMLEQYPGRWKLRPGFRIVIAGSACPESLIRRLDAQGIFIMQPWGLTETSPMATVARLKPSMRQLPQDEQYALRATQGMPLPFIELRAMNDQGEECPWNGEAMGEVQVRGPWIAERYYKRPEENEKWTADGWFRTGDVVTINAHAFIRIVDRTKDLIKSGGEWISSVDVENALVGHPSVREAAVVAVAHPRWAERPLAAIVLRDGARLDTGELRDFLLQRFARWQLPDEFVVVDELPHTSTGKLLKSELRRKFTGWQWSADERAAATTEPGRST
ncbi:MAG: long-chain fatty acid--CoA ligase [Acidobacteria bacterium]|nr:long-chain fatty acid--CoA ligase [Acidobacteriota bacterium]